MLSDSTYPEILRCLNESEESPKLTAAQREQVEKAYQDLTAGIQMLDLSKLMPSIAEIHRSITPSLDSIARALAPTNGFGVDLAKSLELFGPALNLENLRLKNLVDTTSVKVFTDLYSSQRPLRLLLSVR